MATTKTPRKKEKTKRIDLKVGMKDFGPIAEGEIELKPLTVFIGPNNSGKSYAAMLIHSILESYTPASLKGFPFFAVEPLLSKFSNNETLQNTISELENMVESLKIGDELRIPSNVIQKLNIEVFKEIYESRLSKEISRSYACQLKDLVIIGKPSFSLHVGFNSCSFHLICKENKLSVEDYPKPDYQTIDVRFKAMEGFDYATREKKEGKEISVLISGKPVIGWVWSSDDDKRFALYRVVEILCEFCATRTLADIEIPCYYLPAARSGIIQGHKALAASIVRKSTYIGIEKQQEIPEFSGVVSDFISSIIDLPEGKGVLSQLAQESEERLIKGNIIIRSKEKYKYPEIKYRFQGTEIPLHRTSSTVSELAPIFLYLKYYVKPGSIFIIEEPEAHLHPANIRILAKYLVRLVRKGVNVLITTHSDYLLEQINNFYLLSKKTTLERVENFGYDKDDFIESDELGVYEFHYDEDAKGYRINQAEISEDGIIESEIYSATEALYDETSRLQRESDDEE